MRTDTRYKVAAIILFSALAATASADDRADYNKRVAAGLVALFQSLDRNGDGVVTQEESRGDLNLGPRFADIDINRDDSITQEELLRYLEQRYDVRSELR